MWEESRPEIPHLALQRRRKKNLDFTLVTERPSGHTFNLIQCQFIGKQNQLGNPQNSAKARCKHFRDPLFAVPHVEGYLLLHSVSVPFHTYQNTLQLHRVNLTCPWSSAGFVCVLESALVWVKGDLHISAVARRNSCFCLRITMLCLLVSLYWHTQRRHGISWLNLLTRPTSMFAY